MTEHNGDGAGDEPGADFPIAESLDDLVADVGEPEREVLPLPKARRRVYIQPMPQPAWAAIQRKYVKPLDGERTLVDPDLPVAVAAVGMVNGAGERLVKGDKAIERLKAELPLSDIQLAYRRIMDVSGLTKIAREALAGNSERTPNGSDSSV